jgi:FkbM family methyltransferase
MPTVEEALEIAWKQHQAGDLRGAEKVYRQVLQVTPANANAWCFLGMACHDQRRFDDAVEAYRQALQIQPNFPVALSNLGNTLKQKGKPNEAEDSCREAIRLKPDYSTAHNNLGVALVAQGRLREAGDVFEKALALMPNDAVAHANLSAALVRQGKYDEAEASSQQALALNPNYAEAHKNQGIVWLLLGDFERGWPEYEWRWQCAESKMPSYKQPLWDGSPLNGKTILLHHEQGLGDSIQFVRYATALKERGARVIVKVQKPLMKLMAGFPNTDVLVCDDADLPDFDLHVPMLSVPGILKTTLETIPADVPYLAADSSLLDKWKHRLAAYGGFQVGIAWQGSPDFHADAQRSVPLRHFAVLAKVEGVRLFSLQKGYGSEQIEALDGAFEVIDFGDELDGDAGPFMDTAAIMKSLDLIITSDTSVPHLAGALGVPTWTALSVSPDWRWFLEREDCPWYPTMRLYRQTTLDDWEDVFARIAKDLRVRVAARPALPRETDHQAESESVNTGRLLETGFNCLNQCRHGYMLFNRNDVYIGKSLDKYGEFSEGEVAVFRKILAEGDVVVEAGANIGAHTLALAKLVGPSGKIFAFEPQRLVFQTLCANVALNSLSNVECQNVAVGVAAGEIVVPWLAPEDETNFGGLGLGEYKTGEPRDVIALDGLSLPECRLLKIDVEGMELDVLQGAAELISNCQPVMYLENDRQERSPALIEHILALGYRLYWHLPPMFNEDNYFQDDSNIFGRIVSVNMIGIPEQDGFDTVGLTEITDPRSTWQEAH